MGALDQYAVDGRVALVTGAGKGIGRGIALTLAGAGADVVLVARTKADLENVADEVRALGRRALPVAADVTDHSLLPDVVEEAVRSLGRLDMLVNNAGGVEALGPFMDVTVEQIENAFHFNVTTPFELIRLCVPPMLEQGGGAVVNIGSQAAGWIERGFLTYGLVKEALAQLTRMAAKDLSPRIRVNGVVPGVIETDALKGFLDLAPEIRDTMREKSPMRRNGTPEDVAAAVLFLASPAASFITGKLIEVDGATPPGIFPADTPDL